MITRLAISGYRSLRDVRLRLDRLNVVTGANGSGKSSLYRALRLLADVAQGRVVQSLAAEGGLPSTLWAGPESLSQGMKEGWQPVQGTRRKTPIAVKLGFSSADYGYAIDLGLPAPDRSENPTKFQLDPHIKTESLWTGELLGRANEFARRSGPAVSICDSAGAWRSVLQGLATFDSMITHGSDPRESPELLMMRERMRNWRFYDQFRTDAEAPARRRHIGTYTPVLAGDGADLAAAVQTIIEIGAREELESAIDDVFPGAALEIVAGDGFFELLMHQPGLLRPLRIPELSDGTLRYLLLLTALLTPRPPELMVLNEPEASLHPDLLPALARLILQASSRTQIIVVSHAPALVDRLNAARRIVLEKELGETILQDDEPPAWVWPAR